MLYLFHDKFNTVKICKKGENVLPRELQNKTLFGDGENLLQNI